MILYLHQNKYDPLSPCLLLNHAHGPNLEKSRTSKGIEMSLLETVKPSANLSRDLELFVGRCTLDPLLKRYFRRSFKADIISSVDMCPRCKSSATLWSASVETLWMIRKWRNNHKSPVLKNLLPKQGISLRCFCERDDRRFGDVILKFSSRIAQSNNHWVKEEGSDWFRVQK